MATFTTSDGGTVTAVTAAEMRRVDEVAVEETGPELLQMMENAGRNLAGNAREMCRTDSGSDGAGGTDTGPAGSGTGASRVVVLAGNGGNGGGGLCAARHLVNHGVPVEVILDREPADLTGAASTQHRMLDAMGVPVLDAAGAMVDGDRAVDGRTVDERVANAALVVDALVGYSLRGEPRGTVADLIRATEGADRTLSLDVPTGVDATTGERPGVAVDPDRTLTLALPKTGLADVPGRLFLGDIGIPAVVFERADVTYGSPFTGTDRYWLELTAD